MSATRAPMGTQGTSTHEMDTAANSTAGSASGMLPASRKLRVHHEPGTDRGPVPFGRLLFVELRKQVDTRAGRALFSIIGGLTALIMVPLVLFGEVGEKNFMFFVDGALTPQLLLLPVLGILAATSEWSQRTGMVTFALEPRRIRVVAAKLLSALGLGAAAFIFMLIPVAAANLAAIWFRGAPAAWDVDWTGLAGVALLALLGIAMGVGFGLLLLSTPAAIVTYYVTPPALMFALTVIPGLTGVAKWIDMGVASLPLAMYESMDALGWARLAAASMIWVGVPIALGAWRVLRREVK